MISLTLDTKLSAKDMCKVSTLLRLIDAAKPFTTDAIVTETAGTIPLIDELREAIYDIGDR